MKRILCILLALLLLAPAAYADGDRMGYKLTAESGKVGDTVKVVVSVENAPAIISYESVFLYDPAVLKPTGTYQKMYMGGLMAFNPNFTSPVEGKGAVKVAAIGTTGAIMEGDLELYNFTFEIIGEAANEKGTLVEIHSHSFSRNDEELSKVPALSITPCRILVDTAEVPDAPTDDPITTGPSTEEPEEAPDTNTDAADPAPEVEEDKKPTGDWYIFEDQAILAEKDEEGKDVLHQFTVEYEKDEEGNTTGVILYDEEKNEAGKLTVNEDEYGNLTVTEQDMNDEGGFSTWFLLPIGAAVLVAVGGIILAVKTKKKK